MTRCAWGLGIGAAIGLLGACGHEATAPLAGTLSVRLASPHSGQDSAIVFTIVGPSALTSAVAPTGLQLFQQPLGNPSTPFALTGQLNNGAVILTIGVDDVHQVSQYSGVILGVAQPDYQLRPLTGYALRVTRN